MNEEQKDQQLDAAYKRASASDAGRPDAKTRAAILAEAAAAARRRTPAANESRYLMRAVAGLAVIGVGLLVWRQADHRLPGEGQSIEVPVAQQAQQSQLAAESAHVPDPDEPPVPVAPQEQRSRQAAADAAPPPTAEKSEPASPRAQADVARQASAFEPPATAERETADRTALEEVQVTGARILQPRRTVGPRNTVPMPGEGPAALGITRDELSTEELLRAHFPDQYQSATPRRVWLVRDAGGDVTRTGELAPGQQLDGQLATISQSLGASGLTVESVQSLRNARGQLIEITLLRAR